MIALLKDDDPPPTTPQLTSLSQLKQDNLPPSFAEMVNVCLSDSGANRVDPIEVIGFEGFDAYNGTGPLNFMGRQVSAKRIEPRPSEQSETYFVTQNPDGKFQQSEYLPSYSRLQDPWQTMVGGKYVFGAVRTFNNPNGDIEHVRTVIFQGNGPDDMEEVANGPLDMKGIRVADMHDGTVLVTSREGNRIMYRILENISDIEHVDLYDSPLLYKFPEGTWGAINRGDRLNGAVGFLAHCACEYRDGGISAKPYIGGSIEFDIGNQKATKFKPIVSVENVPKGHEKAKRDDLSLAAYPMDWRFSGDLAQVFFSGRDVQDYRMTTRNPFRGYSNIG